MYFRSCLIALIFPCALVAQPSTEDLNWRIDINLVTHDTVKPGSVIMILKRENRIVDYRVVAGAGRFSIDFTVKRGVYNLEISNHLYNASPGTIEFKVDSSKSDSVEYILRTLVRTLKPVHLKSIRNQPRVNQDTIEYTAKQYREADTRKIPDLLRKMEGFNVNQEGQIFYNGKEVSGILIDGDDLAGENYRLLSQNLSAEIVNKVQVVKNYNTNRLLKDRQGSDAVAINLIIDSLSRGRISGSALAGYAPEDRFITDIGISQINSNSKLMAFFNANNVAHSPAFSTGQSTGPDNEREHRLKRMLKPSSIVPPVTLQRYAGESEDATAAIMNSWSTGEYKFRSTLSYSHNSSLRLNSRVTKVFPGQYDEWNTSTTEHENINSSTAQWELSRRLDNKNNRVEYAEINIGAGQARTIFLNEISGKINDSLKEQTSLPELNLRAKLNETWKLKNGQVFHWQTRLQVSWSPGKIQLNTGRFTGYAGVDSIPRQYTQNVDQQNVSLSTSLSHFLRVSDFQLRNGLKLQIGLQEIACTSFQNSGIKIFPDNKTNVRQSSVSWSTAVLMNSHPKVQFSFQSEVSLHKSIINIKTYYNLVYRELINIVRRLSPFQSIMVTGEMSSRIPDQPEIYLGPILTGYTNIQFGLVKPVVKHLKNISASYVSANIFKASLLMISSNAFNVRNEELPSQLIEPGYTILYAGPGSRSSGINFQVNGEKFLLAVKSKLGVQGSIQSSINTFYLNREWSRGHSGYSQLEIRYMSAFKKMNFDFALKREFFSGSIEQMNVRNVSQSTRTSLIYRCRWKPVAKFKLVAEYSVKQLSNQNNRFHSLGVNASYRINKIVALFIDGHNLLDNRAIAFITISEYMTSLSRFGVMPRFVMLKVSVDL